MRNSRMGDLFFAPPSCFYKSTKTYVDISSEITHTINQDWAACVTFLPV